MNAVKAIIIACATDDGIFLADCHFGEARKYLIYRIENDKKIFIGKLENTSRQERIGQSHGDAEKAFDVKSILKGRDVNVILGHKIGPNITRMRKHFVPVVSREREIEKALGSVIEKYDVILAEYDESNRRHFVLSQKT